MDAASQQPGAGAQQGGVAAQPQPQQQGQPQGGGDAELFLRAERAVHRALYENEKSADAIVQTLSPDNPDDSITRAAIQLVVQIDNKINMPERFIPLVGIVTAGELMEVHEAVHGSTFDEAAQKRISMATVEGLALAYDADPQDAAEIAASADEQTQQQAVTEYQQAMKGAA